MKTIFNQKYLLDNSGCYSQEETFGLSFMENKEFTLFDIMNSEIPLKDKFWFVIKKCELTIRQKQEIAIGCGEIVLEIYENKYPDDKRPREAIEAAKKFLNGKISKENLIIKKDAADAASIDAVDADVASAASAAAHASVASAAAYDSIFAAAGDKLQDSLKQFLLDFIANNS